MEAPSMAEPQGDTLINQLIKTMQQLCFSVNHGQFTFVYVGSYYSYQNLGTQFSGSIAYYQLTYRRWPSQKTLWASHELISRCLSTGERGCGWTLLEATPLGLRWVGRPQITYLLQYFNSSKPLDLTLCIIPRQFWQLAWLNIGSSWLTSISREHRQRLALRFSHISPFCRVHCFISIISGLMTLNLMLLECPSLKMSKIL